MYDLEDFLASKQAAHRSWLAGNAPNKIPVFWSGKFTGSEPVAQRVRDFKAAMSSSDTVAFDIGDTEWGTFLDEDDVAHARFAEAAEDMQIFARTHLGGELKFDSGDGSGPQSIGGRGATNIGWNYGSADFADNAIANGTPGRLLLGDVVSPDSGLARIELPRLAAAGFRLNGETAVTDVDALRKLDAAFSVGEDAHRAMFRNADGSLDSRRFWNFENDSKFGQIVTRIEQMIADVAAKGIDVAGKTLKQIEREFVRAYRTSKTKLVQWADYADKRARLVVEALDAATSRLPAEYRKAFETGTKKFREYMTKADGKLDKIRVGAALATGVLAIADLWVELDRRDYDPARFGAYLKEVGKDAIESLPVTGAIAGGIFLVSMTPLGPAVMFGLGLTAGYLAIRKVVDYLANESDLLDRDGITYKLIKDLDNSLKAFEALIGDYIDWATESLKTGVERGLEHVTGSAIEWVSEENAGWVGDGNDILVGDDVSLLIGSDANNWLVHRSAGEVYGEKGDDTLLGWLPEEIKAGQIIGIEGLVTQKVWSKNPAGEWVATDTPIGFPGKVTARELRDAERQGQDAWERRKRDGTDDPANPEPPLERLQGVVRADHDYSLTLDGGEGNDWVISILGEKAITVGGLGKDWVYNTSSKGKIWGDVKGSYRKPGNGTWERYYVDPDTGTEKVIADDGSNSDVFWWSSGTKIMDAQSKDYLKFFGMPLLGGTDDGGLILQGLTLGLSTFGALAQIDRAAVNTIYVDRVASFITYKFDKQKDGSYDLLVGNVVSDFLNAVDAILGSSDLSDFDKKLRQYRGVQVVKNFVPKGADGAFAWTYGGALQSGMNGKSPLNMVFKKSNPVFELLARLPQTLITFAASGGGPLADLAMDAAATAARWSKAVNWMTASDPLVLDLDGDGIETSAADAGVWFNIDGGVFAKRTGWVDGDDGLLAVDANGNGRIDDISELFGSRFEGGFAELAGYDSNGDGKITSADAGFAALRVWRDLDQDGETDGASTGSGRSELYSLAELGIVELNLTTTDLGSAETAEGTRLLSAGAFRRADGSTGVAYEAIFGADDSATRYARERGRPSWQQGLPDMRGFGSVADLGIAMANDIGFAALVEARAASMTVPKLKDLVAQVGDVLGAWGATQETTRELYAVRVSPDGRTLLEAKLWDGTALAPSTGSGGWQLEQGWSPSTRAAPLTTRDEAPYLVQVVNDRAVVLDYGIRLGDGTWTRANAGGSFATRADVLASATPSGAEWRRESFGVNPYATLSVDAIGVRFLEGTAVDYTVEVTDTQGSFHVWARNLDRALELQWKTGDAREFNLRNYEIDFAHITSTTSPISNLLSREAKHESVLVGQRKNSGERDSPASAFSAGRER